MHKASSPNLTFCGLFQFVLTNNFESILEKVLAKNYNTTYQQTNKIVTFPKMRPCLNGHHNYHHGHHCRSGYGPCDYRRGFYYHDCPYRGHDCHYYGPGPWWDRTGRVEPVEAPNAAAPVMDSKIPPKETPAQTEAVPTPPQEAYWDTQMARLEEVVENLAAKVEKLEQSKDT